MTDTELFALAKEANIRSIIVGVLVSVVAGWVRYVQCELNQTRAELKRRGVLPGGKG